MFPRLTANSVARVLCGSMAHSLVSRDLVTVNRGPTRHVSGCSLAAVGQDCLATESSNLCAKGVSLTHCFAYTCIYGRSTQLHLKFGRNFGVRLGQNVSVLEETSKYL